MSKPAAAFMKPKMIRVGTGSAAPVVPLPTWTDSASVASYLTSVVTTVFAVITWLHPGYHEPAVVEAVVPTISIAVAAIAQMINVVMHRHATVKIIQAASGK